MIWMGIVIYTIEDIKKYNPYADLSMFRDDEYYEAKFLEYYNHFCEQIDNLKERLNHKEDKKMDRLFNEIVKQRNDEAIERIHNDYFDTYVELEEFKNEEEIIKLRARIRIVKNLILISEPSNMKRLKQIDDKTSEIIDEVTSFYEQLDGKETRSQMVEQLFDSFNPDKSWNYDLEKYNKGILEFRKKAEVLCEYYRKNYSIGQAAKYINNLMEDIEELLEKRAKKIDYQAQEERQIKILIHKFGYVKNPDSRFRVWVSQLKEEVQKLEKRYKNVYPTKMARELTKKLEAKSSQLIDKWARKSGYPERHEQKLKRIFMAYRPDKLDIFDKKFYSSEEELNNAKEKYSKMTEETKSVFEVRIYEQYIRLFKAKIRDYNNEIRRFYSTEYANKLVASTNKRADKLIRDMAKKIGKPIPRNPWFIRKYLWADTENFMSKKGLAFRKLINPFMRLLVKIAMKNKLVIEERPELDSTKQYVFVPTHYFTEDIIGLYASLGMQGYVLMGTTDQIENNFLMLAAIMMGLFYVDREDSVSRRECIDKQNKIIEMGSNVVNYVGGSWENSENELQPLSFSGPYRTSVAKDVQVVPVGFYLVKEEKKIYVRYGEPIDISKLDEKTANATIRDTLASMHFKQMSKHSVPIQTVSIDGYGKTHNLPYDQHTYYMDQVGNEYWGQYWSKPFAKEEIGVRPKKTVDEADVYSFVDNLSREKLIELSKYLAEPMLRRYERDERYNIVKYIDENYNKFKDKNSKAKIRRRIKEK